ncbi:zinc finger ccch domain protein-related [Anaeramoeba flamelloides]|uniref:Zinc finger ccch domain protein-related n=1 Tax=Anaeramoeba flamelloides TaxID=1746091 RepID=A0ABQ8YWM0_9EUKA|nr:zinc finger ccch domain protein-related [Anaeramoeba flamelloides]
MHHSYPEQLYPQQLTEDISGNKAIFFGSKTIIYNKFDPRLYTVPCKYWKTGNCKMGEHCRFLHGENLSDDPRRPEYTGPPVYITSDGKYKEIPMNSFLENYLENNYPTTMNNQMENSQNYQTKNLIGGYSSREYYEQTSNNSFPEIMTNNNQLPKQTQRIEQFQIENNEKQKSNTKTKNEKQKSNTNSNLKIFKLTREDTRLEKLISRYGRKPFLELIILYSNDKVIKNYSIQLRKKLIVNGIDVYLKYQNNLDKIIKSEELSTIISKSIADFLIVVGDRNLKNKTCHVRKKGKLVEMGIENVIGKIWYDWDQSTKICDYKFGFKVFLKNKNDTEKNHLSQLLNNISEKSEGYTRKELFLLLARHTNLGDIESKIQKLTKLFSTFLEYSQMTININSTSLLGISERILLKTQNSIKFFKRSLIISKQMINQFKVQLQLTQENQLRYQRGKIVSSSFIPKNKCPRIPIKLKTELLEVLKQAFAIIEKIEKSISQYIKNNQQNFSNISTTFSSIKKDLLFLNNNKQTQNNNNNVKYQKQVDEEGEKIFERLKNQFFEFLNGINILKLGYNETLEKQIEKQQRNLQQKRLSSINKNTNLKNTRILRVYSQPSFNLKTNKSNFQSILGNLSTGNIKGLEKNTNVMSSSQSLSSLQSLYKK